MERSGVALALLVASLSATAQTAPSKTAPPKTPTVCVNGACYEPPPNRTDFHPPGYRLLFADEFDGAELNRDVWCTRFIYGGGAPLQIRDPACQQRPGEGNRDYLNDEQQRYRDVNLRGERLHAVGGGVLALRATRTRPDPQSPYESAMIRSKRLFAPTASRSYYITARVRLPNVRGTWPSFWLNSDRKPDGSLQWPPEIDIFDSPLNEKEDKANMLHVAARVRGGKQTASGTPEITFSAPDFDRRWSNYVAARSLRDEWIDTGIEWTARNVCYFVDGYRIMCENYAWAYDDGTPAAPAHILLNLAIGGKWAGRHGIADDKFPTAFYIDHVRVYEKEF